MGFHAVTFINYYSVSNKCEPVLCTMISALIPYRNLSVSYCLKRQSLLSTKLEFIFQHSHY